MNPNLIQVLWVEDDPQNIQSYPIEASRYGLELVPFRCWEEAESALVSDFKRWSAIILDAKCKYKKEDHDNASRFLVHALSSITKICTERKRIIPWYILSGGSEEELNDLILDTREEWDGDWSAKKFYSKTTDRDMLFHRIPYKARVSPEMQIRLVYYPDVFKAIRRAELGDDMEIKMEKLLLPIHTLGHSGEEYNNLMTEVRKCIELLFDSMARNGVLPNQKRNDGTYTLYDKLTDNRGARKLIWCSKILSGKEVKIDDMMITSKKVLPNVIKDSFQRLIEIAGSYEHAENPDATEEQKINSRQTQSFLESIGNAPYLLRSMVMELCTIILWYSNYLDEHDDEELNRLEWEIRQVSFLP